MTKLAFGMGKCELEIRDKRGRLQWEHTINMWDFSTQNRLLRVVQENDLLVGVIGQPRFGLLRLPRDTVCLSDQGQGKVCLGRKISRMTPWDWTGVVRLDVLVLYDPDWALLRRQQVQAMCDWVSNGGTLLLILGRHPLPQDSPLVDLLPFHVGEPRQTEIASETLEQWNLDSSVSETVTAWPLFSKPNSLLAEKVSAGAGGYLYGLGHVGFGRVAVMAFDPAELTQPQAARAADFWTTHVGLCLGGRLDSSHETGRTQDEAFLASHGRMISVNREDENDQQNQPGRMSRDNNRYRIGIARRASNQVMQHLYRLAEMRPLSIWWVILTLTALALLLGPVDYLVLKRLDRLPYTWLTSTGWIVLFTVGAYYGVQALRGGNMQMRTVSVLDGVADSNCAWATSFTGLYSPRSADYRLEGLGPGQWWSGVAPSQEEMWAHQGESALRQIRCLQEDGASLPVSVPINIWTVQSLLTEFPLESIPFTASVERRGEQLVIEVNNVSDHRIVAGCVLLEDAYANVGSVPARSSGRFEKRTLPFNPWRAVRVQTDNRGRRRGRPPAPIPQYPGNLQGVPSNAFLAQGCFNRTVAMHAYLRTGAALVCLEFEGVAAPFGVQDRTYDKDHIQWARLVVSPKDGNEEERDD